MAASDVEICNLALLQIGGAKITTLSDNTKEAEACSLLYERTRRKLLKSHPWSFAQKAADLGTPTETSVSGWSFEYDLPADYLKHIRLETEGENGSGSDGPAGATSLYKFSIRGDKILCDVEDAWLLYVYDHDTETDFPDLFEDALIYKLAGELAMPITGDPAVKQSMVQMYQIAYGHATAEDSDEPTFIPLEGDLLDARA